jgi:hypothetical protein
LLACSYVSKTYETLPSKLTVSSGVVKFIS